MKKKIKIIKRAKIAEVEVGKTYYPPRPKKPAERTWRGEQKPEAEPTWWEGDETILPSKGDGTEVRPAKYSSTGPNFSEITPAPEGVGRSGGGDLPFPGGSEKIPDPKPLSPTDPDSDDRMVPPDREEEIDFDAFLQEITRRHFKKRD